jgi:hypothetical protein
VRFTLKKSFLEEDSSMSTINNISSSLLDSYLLTSQQSNSNQSTTDQKSNIPQTDAQTQTSGSGNVDTVTLSKEILQQLNENLLSAQSTWLTGSSGSDDSGSGSNGIDSSSMYDVLISAENAQLMQASPDLVKNIISEEQAQSTGDSSSSSTQTSSSELVQNLKNLDLLAMNPETLRAIQQKYMGSSASEEQTASGSQVTKKA